MGSGGDWEGREYRPAEDFDGQSLACGVHLYATARASNELAKSMERTMFCPGITAVGAAGKPAGGGNI